MIYRVKLFTNNIHKEYNDQKYCMDNNIFAIGWGDEFVKDFAEYKSKFDEQVNKQEIKHTSGQYQSMKNICDMKIGDFVWAQINARCFLLGKVDSDVYLDNNNRRIGPVRKCNWREVKFDNIPGKIVSCFVGIGPTLQRVNVADEFEKYCEYLYDNNIKQCQIKDYKSLLHYDDLEDLLGLYLQEKESYFIIPSTNKTSTKLIEYELRKADGQKACTQCKIGNSTVDINEIKEEFSGYKIYIATINNIQEYTDSDVEKIDVDILWNWAKEHRELLPERIKNYINISNY